MIGVPTTKGLVEAIQKDLRTKLDLPENELRKVATALSAVLGAQLKLVYLRVVDVQRNLYPDTADLAENGGELERLGRIYLNRGINPATSGVYRISVTGEANGTIRPSLTFKSNDDSRSPGELFVADNQTVLTGNNDEIEIRALSGGSDFILDVGDQLTITEPVIGVEQVVEISEVVELPTNAESVEDYRQAILDAIQLEPQGGARTDYRLWAADAAGVRRVYPYVKDGNAGVVQVYVEATQSDSTDGNGTPAQAILDEVAEVIEFDPDDTKPTNERGRRPIQATIEVLPISLTPVDVAITGLATDTADIRTAIETNLKTYLVDIRPFIAGADLPSNKNDVLYASRLSGVVTDVLAADNSYGGFTMSVDGVAVSDYTMSGDNIPYLRNLTFN